MRVLFSLYGSQVVLRFVLQTSEEPEEGAGCHDDSPVLFDFDEEDDDEDSYGMLVSVPLSYDAW